MGLRAHLTDGEPAGLRVSADPVPGINFVGPVDTGSGLGEAARLLVRAIEHAGVPCAVIAQPGSPRHDLATGERPTGNVVPYDVNVLCIQPDQLEAFGVAVGPRFFADRTTIGFWFWESTALPDHHRPALRLLDRLWVTSEHVRGILGALTSAPLQVVPLPIAELPAELIPRSALGLPRDAFVFLTMLDLVSARRKNPYAAIEAFCRAFEPGSGAALVLKTINGRDREPHRLAELERAAASREDVTVLDGYVPAAERDALIAACDCYVSLHRAEGLGLPMLEAMAAGKPVIATGFSGNLDFMDDTTGYLVPFELVAVPKGEWGYSPAALWADPSVEAAASHMRRVFDDRKSARLVGANARRTVLDRFSLDRAASTVASELEAARSQLALRERARRRHPVVDASLALAGDPTRAPYPGRGPTARLRRLLVRALWPQLEALYRRDAAMLEGISEVERSLARLEERMAAVDETAGSSGSRPS